MIGPITAIVLLIAAGLGLSAWGILRRHGRGRLEDGGLDPAVEEPHFAIGLETREASSQ